MLTTEHRTSYVLLIYVLGSGNNFKGIVRSFHQKDGKYFFFVIAIYES